MLSREIVAVCSASHEKINQLLKYAVHVGIVMLQVGRKNLINL